MQRGLVLGGGGLYGSAWESGVLIGLAQTGIDVREADTIVGTSAGSQIGAVIAAGVGWEEIWARQSAPQFQGNAMVSSVDMPTLFRGYEQMQAEARNVSEWILGLCRMSIDTRTMSEAERLSDIATRLHLSAWPERLRVVSIDTTTGERVVWNKQSGVDLIPAVAASCALPGVYPAITIGKHRYCDGGVYSMENADLVEGCATVLILRVGLPISTPYQLDDHIALLRRSGARVEVIQPDEDVLAAFQQVGSNPIDPRLRAPVAHAARLQGLALSKQLAPFWNTR